MAVHTSIHALLNNVLHAVPHYETDNHTVVLPRPVLGVVLLAQKGSGLLVKVWHCRMLAFRPIRLPEMDIYHNGKYED